MKKASSSGSLVVPDDIITQLSIAFSDFEKFLTSRKNEWEIKLKEVEDKFLELGTPDNLADVPSEPKRKRRKTSSVHPQVFVKQDPFASYAAELQVMFFKKVQTVLLVLFENYGIVINKVNGHRKSKLIALMN